MANGDAASAAFGWTPVLPTDDIRLGYDRINALADALAAQAGYGAWSLAPISPAANFGTLTDPAGNTSGTLAGGVRKAGGALHLSFRLTYTGTTITATAGDITDTTAATLAAGYRPTAPRFVNWGPNGQGMARLGSDGVLQLITLDSTNTLPSGRVIQIDGVVPL
jgi:hypothetical protein